MGCYENRLEARALTNGTAIQAVAHARDGRQSDHMSLLATIHVHDVHVDPETRDSNDDSHYSDSQHLRALV